MMRWLFLFGTGLFWIAVLALWAATRWLPPATEPPAVAERRLSIDEVARHASPDDCWLAIDPAVYDVSRYLPEHPSKPGIVEPWCGKEATEAYRTKMKGRAHSPQADDLLTQYRVGVLGRP